MNLLEQINTISNANIAIKEDFSYCNIEVEVQGTELLANVYDKEFITSLFDNISEQDSLKVFIDLAESSIVSFRDRSSIESTLAEYDKNLFEDDDSYVYTLKIDIEKELSNQITIYSHKDFFCWLTTFDTLKESWEKYKIIESIDEQIYFYLQNTTDIHFCTQRFVFSSVEQNTRLQGECSFNIDKRLLVGHQKGHCFVSGESAYKMIPDDFYLIRRSGIQEVDTLFDKLCMLIVLTFLTDISEFKEDSIYYKLYGYKTIADELNLENINVTNLQSFFNIYAWIYHDNQQSTISDKLGMARNLITLHVRNTKLDEVEGDVFTAVKSNFDIYLKENVQRYLEVKNQVSTFIYDMSIKAENNADMLANSFKNNLLIFISYFVSIIIVTAIDKSKSFTVFTVEVTGITFLILLISWFYRKYIVEDIKAKKNRFDSKYLNFRNRYADILDEMNLDSLFGENKDHELDIQHIENAIIKYDKFWKNTIYLFAFFTTIFCLTNDTSSCLNRLFELYYFIKGIFC